MVDPGRQARSRRGFSGSRLWPLSTNCSVSQPFALDPIQNEGGAFRVFDPDLGAVRVTKIEFGQIAVQMGLGDVEIDPIDAAFQDGEETLDRVREHVVPDIFLGGMYHVPVWL